MNPLSKIGRPLIVALALAAPLGLGACGKLGDLEQPAPLFGEAAKAKYEAEKRAAAVNGNDANRPSAPGTNRENIDPASSGGTSRQPPIPGTNPDPFGGPSGPGFPGSGPAGR
jgi:hypothetical protein